MNRRSLISTLCAGALALLAPIAALARPKVSRPTEGGGRWLVGAAYRWDGHTWQKIDPAHPVHGEPMRKDIRPITRTGKSDVGGI